MKVISSNVQRVLVGVRYLQAFEVKGIVAPGVYKHQWCQTKLELEPDDWVFQDSDEARFNGIEEWNCHCPVCGGDVILLRRKIINQ